MGFPKRQAAVVGVYSMAALRLPDRSGFSLQMEAIKGALEDAGLTIRDVDGLIPLLKSSHLDGTASAPQFWAEQLGGRPLKLREEGPAAGALVRAAACISAGLADVVVAFYGKSGRRTGPRGTPVPRTSHAAQASQAPRAPRAPEWGYTAYGAYMTTFYALWAQRYMHEFGVTSADLAEVAVFTRHHAVLNSDSVMGRKGEITVADVVSSRYICEPLHLFDCSIDNDGCYAVVLASADRAQDCRKTPIWVLGGAEAYYTDFYSSFTDDWFPADGNAVRSTADRAFGLAGVSRDDIDVAGLYDCFTITTIRDLEEMGFCKVGEGAEFVKEGHCKLGGRLPTNTDGGLLSNSHPGDASGLHTIEIVRQLRGECGVRQVPDAKLGVALQQGYAVHGVAGTLVLAAD
jgi:acetyl-CoA acetyltransferase